MSAPVIFKRDLVLQLLALVAVCGLLVYASLSSDKQLNKILPEAHTWASTTNLRPSGMSACFELTEKLFAPQRTVKKWELPYRMLGGSKKASEQGSSNSAKLSAIQPLPMVHGVLIIVSPDQSLANFEVEEILSWVERGNYLVYLDSFILRTSRRLLDKTAMAVRQLEPPANNRKTDPRFDVRFYDHLRQLTVSADHSIKGGGKIATVDGACIIAEKEYGKGRILVASCPSLVSNRQISQVQYWSNFQFMYNWLATTEGEIYFDERCHGLSQGINVFYYFLRGPTGCVLAQLGLLLLVAVLSTNQRFGAATPIKVSRQISNLEHINGLSNTYMRAKAKQAVIEIIWQSVRLKLCKFLQISPHESRERLLEELKANGGEQTSSMAIIAEQCEKAISNRDLSDAQLIELVESCDKISQRTDKQMTSNQLNRGQDAATSSTDRE
ncbi:DUF4350 domain-containing protein [bacterium]|nr:DUF4350 domain-containing protein [bacterium]MBP9806949.1 DUF4350 domain-containing protein [bacterium]